MIITLSNETKRIVVEKVSSGAYESPDEVVNRGVRLLDAREKGVEALRREIMLGFEDIQQGRFTTISSDEELDAFTDDLISQAKELRDASKN